MWTARLGPYSIGSVRWRSPRPSLTVVVKTTLTIDRDGPMRSSPIQLGLAADHRGIGASDDELEHSNDFVPRKAHADLLVVGNARAAAPVTTIPVRIELGTIAKRVVACAGSAAMWIPLASSHLRQPSGAARTAPHAMRVPEWARRELPDGFDFRRFNVAPVDQQTNFPTAGSRLVLEGLWPSLTPREAWLPELEPLVWYLALGVEQGHPREIPMVADTIWIHADRQLCTVCWRGVLERVPAQTPTERLVVMARAQCPAGWSDAVGRLAEASWVRAEGEPDRSGPPREQPIDAPAAPGVPSIAIDAVTRWADADEDGEEQATCVRAPLERPEPNVGSAGRAPATALGVLAAPGPQRAGQATLQLEEEPAPVTPRAGLALGAGRGAALGGVVLCSQPSAADALPYRATTGPAPERPASGARGTANKSWDMTVVREEAGPSPQPAVPFVPLPSTAGPPTEPSVRRVGVQTAAMAAQPPPSASPLPFGERPASRPAAPAARPSATGPGSLRSGGTMVVELGRLQHKPLPAGWVGPAPADERNDAPVAPAESSQPGPAPASAAPPLRVPTATSHPPLSPVPSPPGLVAAPVPAERPGPTSFAAVSTIPIDTYAAIKSALWQPNASLPEVLSLHGVDEARWHANEHRLEQALEREAAEGRSDLSSAIRAALVRSRKERPEVDVPSMTLDEYAALRVAVESAETAASVLEAHQLGPEQWQRLRRHWHQQSLADPALAAQLRAAIVEARRTQRARALGAPTNDGETHH